MTPRSAGRASPRAGVLASLVLTCLVLAAACELAAGPGERVSDRPAPTGSERVDVVVTSVVDGDTVRVRLGGDEVPLRLIGIDTPERDGPYTDEECFGEAASRYTAAALDGREVGLEFDVERTDRFDRTLAYVWIDGELFNEAIVLDGHAVVATFPPNVRYVDRLLDAQRQARDRGVGLWSSCET